MPWPAKQRKAIAARMKREGKSEEEISAFFRAHGHGKSKGTLRKAMQKPSPRAGGNDTGSPPSTAKNMTGSDERGQRGRRRGKARARY